MPPSSVPASAFDAVVFDAYGTLFDVHSVTSLAEQLRPGMGSALSALWRQKQLEYSWLRAMSGRYKPFWDITQDALDYCNQQLGLNLAPAEVMRLLNQYSCLSAFPENLDALRALRNLGIRLGILSNGNREMLEVSIRSAGMGGLFEHVLSAETVRSFKTTDAVYALAPNAFGCDARRILFVSSNGWDAAGAHWWGFTTCWINRGGNATERLDVVPHHIVSRLDEIVPLAAGARSGA